jgi:hypothetical protein
MSTFLDVAAANTKEWIRKNHRSYQNMEPELLKIAGVESPKEAP